MKFDYFDMLSGEPIYVSDVGHLRSPKLKELCPSSGIGYAVYNMYLNFLTWDKAKMLQQDKLMGLRGADRLALEEKLTTYDVITLLPQTREFCREVLSFFIAEKIQWNDSGHKFTLVATAGEEQVIGEINRANFEDIRSLILQLNFIGLDQESGYVKHTSAHSKELWEKAQKFLKQQAEANSSEDKPEYHIGNIVSKLCAAHPSYNLLNVWDLTVFQFYDAFFQLGYLRSSSLNEAIFSNHGGNKFRFEDWIKPILKNV